MGWTDGRMRGLLLQNRELSACGEILSVLRGEGGEAQEAGLDRLCEEYALLLLVVLELSFTDGVTPGLSIEAGLDAVVLDVAVAGVLTG